MIVFFFFLNLVLRIVFPGKNDSLRSYGPDLHGLSVCLELKRLCILKLQR